MEWARERGAAADCAPDKRRAVARAKTAGETGGHVVTGVGTAAPLQRPQGAADRTMQLIDLTRVKAHGRTGRVDAGPEEGFVGQQVAEAGNPVLIHEHRLDWCAASLHHVAELRLRERERIRTELAGNSATRSIRRAHCDVVASVDAPARKVYSIGGNILQSITARKMNLSRGLKFSAAQKGRCGGPGQWTLPQSGGGAPAAASEKCSLNDKKWFVLLQVR